MEKIWVFKNIAPFSLKNLNKGRDTQEFYLFKWLLLNFKCSIFSWKLEIPGKYWHQKMCSRRNACSLCVENKFSYLTMFFKIYWTRKLTPVNSYMELPLFSFLSQILNMAVIWK